MSYNLSHQQHTVHYIVEQLRYNSSTKELLKLSASDKKWLERELLAAIEPLQARNPKNIAINSNNSYLAAFFGLIAEKNIVFPADTTYLLKRNGTSYECHGGERKIIYDRQKIKVKNAASRLSELDEQLRRFESDDASSSEVSDDEYTAYYAPGYSSVSLSDFVVTKPKAQHCTVKAKL